MSSVNKEQGFSNLLVVLVLALSSGLFISSLVPINRHYNDGKASVAGISTVNDNKGIGDSVSSTKFKISSDSGQTAVVDQRIGALSPFPLSANPQSNELTINTPTGSKVVTVLPQKAVNNLLASHVMNDVVSEKAAGSLASVPQLIKLNTKNGVLVYEVKGTKTNKLLGFIPIKTKVNASVSAENGQVVEGTQSLFGRILSKVAP